MSEVNDKIEEVHRRAVLGAFDVLREGVHRNWQPRYVVAAARFYIGTSQRLEEFQALRYRDESEERDDDLQCDVFADLRIPGEP